MRNKTINEEIDLVEILISIWKNKLKIIFITSIFIVLVTAFYFIKKPRFTTITDIEPISIFEENLYYPYNTFLENISDTSKIIVMMDGKRTKINDKKKENFKKLNSIYLQKLFLAKIRDNKIITEAIDRFELIDKTKFKSEELYFDAVKKFALTLRIIAPEEINKKRKTSDKREIKSSWRIKFETYDVDKWQNILKYLDNEINNEIKNELISDFLLIKKTADLLNKFKLEDIDIRIKDSMADYERDTKDKLAFLNEQREIARELGIAKSTLALETLNSNSTSFVIQSNQIDNPYYMRGYNMIEKEIDLIKSRTDKVAFIEDLQDLEKQKRYLKYNQELIRLYDLFKNTPIHRNDFKASKIIYRNSESTPSSNLLKLLLLASIVGLIFGIFFSLVSDVIKKRNYK